MSDVAKLRPALLRTSAATDVKRSGGVVTITGLQSFRDRDILAIKQFKYKAEVVQVIAVGGGSYTPAASTKYTVQLENPAFSIVGNQINPVKRYSYTTPADITTLGATAALQREAIHAALVIKINNDAKNFVAAVSLGTGTGFSITDDAGYYPARVNGASNGRKGATIVKAATNPDGTGFTSSNISTTTSAVYGFGVGARLLQDTPVFSFMTGNLTGGELDAPQTTAGLFAVSGQQYDAFGIQHVKLSEVPAVSGVQGLKVWEQIVFVDNGSGTDTTNLSGYKAFIREMHKLIFYTFRNDPKTVQEWFDAPIVFQDPLGAAPTGTANTLGWQSSQYTALNRTNIGTQTIVAPVLAAAGLLLDQDDTAGEGNHTSANQQTLGAQSFIVGQEEFSVVCTVVAADWTDTHFMVGFRKKAAYTADYNDYTDLAAIGGGAADGDSITTTGILNNAATVATDTTVNFADGVSIELRIKVAIDGTVTAYANGVAYSILSAASTPLIFDAADEMIAFYQHVNIGNGDPAVTISKFVAVASSAWMVD